MEQINIPEDVLEKTEVSDLLKRALELKKAGFRFSQAHASYIDEKFELSYSFSNYDNYGLHTLRIVIDPETEVPSITEIIPAAVFYENEMKELYGVKISMISVDYNNRLYRIRQETPMGPKKTGGEE
ncbi:MAG: NADH-quinone oxidoreductase subunit C [Lachnospiraceae bacterium]|nr:NADH-quinone oxidoreductase subunit C [Lachnospiraceae bacterium]